MVVSKEFMQGFQAIVLDLIVSSIYYYHYLLQFESLLEKYLYGCEII